MSDKNTGQRVFTRVGDVVVQLHPAPPNEVGLEVTRPEGSQMTYLSANMLRVLIRELQDALQRIDDGRG